MLLQEPEPRGPASTGWKWGAKLFAALSLASLLALSAVLALTARWPSSYLVMAAEVLSLFAVLAGAAALVAGGCHIRATRRNLVLPLVLLTLLTALVFGAHLYVINSPPTSQCTNSTKLGCIMDEVFYVPSAQGILSGEQCAPYADNCNLEHPFLAKGLIAAGTAIFGSNDLGWRFFNALLGSLSVPLLFGLVYLLSGNVKMSSLSAIFLSTDTMFFVHSSAAVIDIPSVFFTLLAFIFYFWRGKFWKVNNYMAAGVMLGLALLAKETAIFAVGVLFVYELLFAKGPLKRSVLRTAGIVLTAALVFFAGLQVYDTLFTSASVPTFIQQIAFIFKYGSALDCPPAAFAVTAKCGMWVDGVLKSYITPLNWLTYYSPVSYFVTNVTTTIGTGAAALTYSYVETGYYGVNNVITLWTVFVWVPLAVYALRRKRPEGEEPPRDESGMLFVLVWLALTYVPYVGLWLWGRVTYPFYILPAVPALSTGAAFFATRSWFPRWLVVVFVLAAVGWFVVYFPVKDFLPVFVRAWLGR